MLLNLQAIKPVSLVNLPRASVLVRLHPIAMSGSNIPAWARLSYQSRLRGIHVASMVEFRSIHGRWAASLPVLSPKPATKDQRPPRGARLPTKTLERIAAIGKAIKSSEFGATTGKLQDVRLFPIGLSRESL